MSETPAFNIDVADLADKWYSEARSDDRPCAACGKPVSQGAHGRRFEDLEEEEGFEDDAEISTPFVMFKKVDGVTFELDLHWRCATPRMKGGGYDG